MSNDDAEAFEANLKTGKAAITEEGKTFEVTPDMVEIVRQQKTEHGTSLGPGPFVLFHLCAFRRNTRSLYTFFSTERKFVPHVIEPSFGLGRIIYALLEHSFDCREGDEQRQVSCKCRRLVMFALDLTRFVHAHVFRPNPAPSQWLRLSPNIAPVKCSLLPLSNAPEFNPFLDEIGGHIRDGRYHL
jgi:glycyl-tRNA synthetase